MYERETGDRGASVRRVVVTSLPWVLLLLGVLRVVVTVGFVRTPAGFVFGNDFVDLGVYRMGGDSLLHGVSVYGPTHSAHLLNGDTVEGLKFIYPLFAAAVMVPLSLLPFNVAAAMMVAAGLASVAVVGWLMAGRLSVVAGAGLPWSRPVAALGIAGLCCALEPVTSTLEIGQVNLILMAAVLVDVLVPWRGTGVLTGLATGIKLTPVVFILAMGVTRRWRDAAVAAATFVLTVLIGLVLQPGPATGYWRDFVLSPSQHTETNPFNQSLYADALRLFGGGASRWIGVTVAVAVIAGTLWMASLLWPYEPISATIAVAMGGLLVSPISWNNHWVWFGPAIVVLAAVGVRAWRAGDRLLAACCLLFSTVTFALDFLGPLKLFIKSNDFGGTPREWVLSNIHVLPAVVCLVLLAIVARRRESLWAGSDVADESLASDARH